MDQRIDSPQDGQTGVKKDRVPCQQDVIQYGEIVDWPLNVMSLREINDMCERASQSSDFVYDWWSVQGGRGHVVKRLRKDWVNPTPFIDIKDHEIREVVTNLTKIGKGYGHTQQLRERISYYIVDILRILRKPRDVDLTQIKSSRFVKEDLVPTFDRATQAQISAVWFNTLLNGGQITEEQEQQLIEFITNSAKA